MNVQPLATALATACADRGLAYAEGKRPAVTGTKPYVVAWFDAGVHRAHTLADPVGDHAAVGVFHCVGLTPESARVAAGLLTDAVYSLRGAALSGRVVQFPEQLSAQPLSRDDDADPPLYEQVVEWRFRTTPA